MQKKIDILNLCILFFPLTLMAAQAWTFLEKGNKFYFLNEFDQALTNYYEAENIDSTEGIIPYNIACALYKKKLYDRAMVKNDSALTIGEDNLEIKFKSLTNKGNAAFLKKDFSASIEAYKESLRLHPGDVKTKYNLALALHQLKKNPQQKQNEDKQKKKESSDNKTEYKQKEKEEEEKKSQQNQDKNKNSEQKNTAPENINKDIKTQMLKMIDQQEKEVNRRLMQGDKGAISGSEGKDW